MTDASRPPAPARRSPRLQHEILVAVNSDRGQFSGWGTNLSMDGVFVNSSVTSAVGTAVNVLLQLPGAPECRLHGRVAWLQPPGPTVEAPGMGIEFLDSDASTRNALGALVERLRVDLGAASS